MILLLKLQQIFVHYLCFSYVNRPLQSLSTILRLYAFFIFIISDDRATHFRGYSEDNYSLYILSLSTVYYLDEAFLCLIAKITRCYKAIPMLSIECTGG